MLQDGGGQIVLKGSTELKDFDGATGDTVHWIDFSAYVTPGQGYTLALMAKRATLLKSVKRFTAL